MVKKKVQN